MLLDMQKSLCLLEAVVVVGVGICAFLVIAIDKANTYHQDDLNCAKALCCTKQDDWWENYIF